MNFLLRLLVFYTAVNIDCVLTTDSGCQRNVEDFAIGDAFNISSPGYPNFYPDDLECFWSIISNDDGNYAITFEELSLLFLETKNVDYFTLGRGNNTKILQESVFIAPGTTVLIDDQRVWVRFQSDWKYAYRGFHINIQRIVSQGGFCKSHSKLCIDGRWCAGEDDSVLICNERSNCLHDNDFSDCDSCSHGDFWCSSGIGCLNQSFVCDDRIDCLDGSDEFNCHTACAPGWDNFDKSCFQVQLGNFTFTEAESICLSMDSNLASIHSQVENDFVANLIEETWPEDLRQTDRSFWDNGQSFLIGLNDQKQEGDFRWSDGMLVTYDNFGDSEPNNVVNEDCAYLRIIGVQYGKWFDLPCHLKQNFICKKSQETCGTQWMEFENGERTYLTSVNYPYVHPDELLCIHYLIARDIIGTFVITFFRLDVTNNSEDSLHVGVGTDALNGTTRTDKFNWHIAPNTITMHEPKIWLKFTSDHKDQRTGFFIEMKRTKEYVTCRESEFQCETGFGCLDASLLCSGVPQCLDLSDEDDDCDFCGPSDIRVSTGEISHLNSVPAYPYNYQNNQYCTYYIAADELYGFIEFKFIHFHLETWYDYFSIGYGNEIKEDTQILRLHGTKAPRTLTLNSTLAWATFESDGGARWWGHVIEVIWHANYVGCFPDEYTCTSGYGCYDRSLLCDEIPQCLDESDEELCDVEQFLCGGEYMQLLTRNGSSRNLTSKNYPSRTANLEQCTWNVTAVDGGLPTITFVDAQLPDTHDFLYIGHIIPDGRNDFVQATGTRVPISVTSAIPSLEVTYQTFELYTVLERRVLLTISWSSPPVTCNNDEFQCEDTTDAVICIALNKACDGVEVCPDGSDEQNCGVCYSRNINLGSDTELITLTSPDFPYDYPDSLACEWNIYASVEDRKIILTITDFYLEEGFDFLDIGDGKNSAVQTSTLVRLTGEVKLRTIISAGPAMWVNIATDGSGTGKGFSMNFEQDANVDDVCLAIDFDCGQGYCVDSSALCNGFDDCLNLADEIGCPSISCPGSYTCDQVPDVAVRSCVRLYQVCDGNRNCPAGDDEKDCHLKRCPSGCECTFVDSNVQIKCTNSWTTETLLLASRITTSMTLSGSIEPALKSATFKNLPGLSTLSVTRNSFSSIEPGAFNTPTNLTWLDLSYNYNLTILLGNTFASLGLLDSLFLLDVPLYVVDTSAFEGLRSLLTLVMVRGDSATTDLQVKPGAFSGLNSLRTLYIDDHRLCCFFSNLDTCQTVQPHSPLFNCGSLMQNYVLRIFMWILGISALVGNTFVIILRLKEQAASETQKKQRIFICNLAISDSLMGIYMVMLASADIYYGDDYFNHSDEWRNGVVCRITGFLGLLSSEASVFFITLITIDRFICLAFPFSQAKMYVKSSKRSVGFLWFVAFVVSIVPVLMAGPESDFYDLSDVCIGLPLITRPSSFNFESQGIGGKLNFNLPVAEESKPAWYFSIALFLGLNMVCFSVILICYVMMFVAVRRTGQKVGRKDSANDEIKMAIKMAAIVGTDFVCWFPIILMGILSQVGAVVIPLDAYVWLVVFVLPINSSLNPYLYTITTLISERRSPKNAIKR